MRSWIGTPNPLHDQNLESLIGWADDPRASEVLAINPDGPLPDFVRDTAQLEGVFAQGVAAAKRALRWVTWL